jgi:formate dehydrogenase iron-sulfur subunit
MVDGVATKCDGCADVTAAGGTPWCVLTCPSDALRYGNRAEIADEAHHRVAALRAKHPDAQVYGESQAGGLGVIMVLPDDPETLGLPADPRVPVVATAWQGAVKPAGFGVTAFSAIAAGLAAVIARRNHMQELALVDAAEPTDEVTP